MSSKTKTLLLVAAFVVFMAAAAIGYSALSAKAPPIAPPVSSSRQTEPTDRTAEPSSASGEEETPKLEFSVRDAAGETVAFSDLVGKPVVLNFWASWCGYCVREMPDFEAAYKELGDDVSFMMVNATDGQRETLDKAEAFISDSGYTFPVYFDVDGEAVSACGIRAFPTTYFFKADGGLAGYAPGMLTAEQLRSGLELITAD